MEKGEPIYPQLRSITESMSANKAFQPGAETLDMLDLAMHIKCSSIWRYPSAYFTFDWLILYVEIDHMELNTDLVFKPRKMELNFINENIYYFLAAK